MTRVHGEYFRINMFAALPWAGSSQILSHETSNSRKLYPDVYGQGLKLLQSGVNCENQILK